MMRALAVFLIGCGSPSNEAGETGASAPPADQEPVCEEASEVTCVDDLILDLSLHNDAVSAGSVRTTVSGSDFLTDIDATAGGYSNATQNPWVYLRFTDDGAEKVELDDEAALESMDWDLAARRFIIRLNGGSSGPSCVGAATILESSYDALTAIPEGLSYGTDDYYTPDCTLINDSSGLPDSPQVVLGSWWTYPGCVATSGYPHLIQTADGRVLKMVVEAYYATGQETCNDAGIPGEGSANLSIRWTWMQ
ncbi:MAG: HmuY family protein [Myxococcota bacterium]|nr:HmuY family protein [Myxococcota bacterium]